MVKNLSTVERSTKIRFGRYTKDDQAENTVVFNASNVEIDASTPGTVYMHPIRVDQTTPSGATMLMYDATTKEIQNSNVLATDVLFPVAVPNLNTLTAKGAWTSNTVLFQNAFTSFTTTQKVGISNTNPIHTIDIGSNVFIDESGSNCLAINPNPAENFTGNVFFGTRVTILPNVLPQTEFQTVDSNALAVYGNTFIDGSCVIHGDSEITGNLIIGGQTSVMEAVNVTIDDPILELGNNNVSNNNDLGVIMTRPGGTHAAFGFRGHEREFMIGYTQNDASGVVLTPDTSANANVHIYGDLTVSDNVSVANKLTVTKKATFSDANVAVEATGNVSTSGYFIGDGSKISNIPTDFENIIINGNVTSNIVEFRDMIILKGADTSFVTSVSNAGLSNLNPVHTLDVGSNVFVQDTGSNVLTTRGGLVSLSNITTEGYFIGDGSKISNIPTDFENIIINGNATSNVVYFNDSNISLQTTGNVVVDSDSYVLATLKGNVYSNNVFASDGIYGPIKGSNTIAATTITATTVNATTVDAQHKGDGGLLSNVSSTLQAITTSLPDGSGNTTTKTVAFTNANTGIAVTSNVTIGSNISVGGLTETYLPMVGSGNWLVDSPARKTGNKYVVTAEEIELIGNVTVVGNSVILESNITTIEDRIFGIARDNADHDADMGIIIENQQSGTQKNVALAYHGATHKMTMGYTSSNVVADEIEALAGHDLRVDILGNLHVQNTITINKTGNFTDANVAIQATGNVVTDKYFIGDGSQISNIPTDFENIIINGNVTSNIVEFRGPKIAFITATSNVGLSNLNPIHTLDIGSNIFAQDTGSNVLTTRGGLLSLSNITTEGYFIGDGSKIANIPTDFENIIINGNATSNIVEFRGPKTSFVTATSNVGISNLNPVHTLDVGSNLYAQDTGSNVLTIRGNVSVSDVITIGGFEVGNSSTLQQVSDEGATTDNTLTLTHGITAINATSNIVTSSGRIGIGTTTPATAFEVLGSATNQPPGDMSGLTTSITGHGVYTSSSSSNSASSYKVFDTVGSNLGWMSAATYSGGVVTGGSPSIGGISGEWIKLHIPYSIYLTSLVIKGTWGHNPKDINILGSSDDSSWTSIKTAEDIFYSGNSVTISVNATADYSYFAIVVTKTSTGGTPDGTTTSITDLNLSGKSTTTIEDGILTVPRGIYGPIAGANTLTGSTVTTITSYSNVVGNVVQASYLYGPVHNSSNVVYTSGLYGPIVGSNVVSASSVISGEAITTTTRGANITALTGFHGPIVGSNAIAASTITGTSVTIDDYLIHAGDTNTKVGFSGADTIQMTTGGIERMRVDSSGNVSVGGIAPESRLHLYGTDNLLMIQSHRSPYPKISLDWSGTNGENLRFYDHHGSGRGFLYGRKYTTGTNANSSAGWHFYGNDDTLALRIDSSAKVGIGTTTPVSTLQVGDGDTTPTSGDASGSISVAGTGATKSNGGKPGMYHRALVGLGLWSDGQTSFEVNGYNGNQTEAMRIAANANVGIGTTVPADKLEIYKSGGSDNVGMVIKNGTRQWRAGVRGDTSSVFAIQDDTANAFRMVINSSGKVGIGTTTPVANLHVASNGPTYTGVSANDRFRIEETVNNGNRYGLQMGIDWGSGHSALQTYLLSGGNYTANYYLLLQPYGSNVGIGTTGPASALHIKNTSANCLYVAGNNAGNPSGGLTHTTQFMQGFRIHQCNGTNSSTAGGSGWAAHSGGVVNAKQNGITFTQGAGTPNSGSSSIYWTIGMIDEINTGWSNFGFAFGGQRMAYVNKMNNNNELDFTGQHRSYVSGVPFSKYKDYEGLIVSANKNEYYDIDENATTGLEAIQISQSLPLVSVSNVAMDKACFGVISGVEDPDTREYSQGRLVSVAEKIDGDSRAFINSVGEGAIWVINTNGNLESGDYITTSNVAGYGMKQNDDILHNYTVAKITMDCDFNPATKAKRIVKTELRDVTYYSNATSNISYTESDYMDLGDEEKEQYTLDVKKKPFPVLDSDNMIQWENHASDTEKAYKLRYLDANGVETAEADKVYTAAFVGCTYHCG